ncbi:alpha/beta hydrolase [Sphingopyxis sp. JAI128]|uniref:alpha/beta fold hydrolase n=1 Tax=Sphingopyxis sp. JAI128 TaxID=2723066 RepID=UPI0028936616|nr:alpha/beta hydrolase [Sphingopyxis sp. JAI128]
MIVSLFFASLAMSGAVLTPSAPAGAAVEPDRHLLCKESILRRARNGEVEIAYRTAGDRTGEPLLMIPGSGMQLVDWPQPLVDDLVRAGYYLIMPDPRDAGCSTKLDELGPPDWPRVLADLAAGRSASLAYDARDLVSDMAAVLDAEGLASAHLLGASGGAVIGEVMAIERPGLARSLTLLMANAGNPSRALPARPDVMAPVAQGPTSTDGKIVEAYLMRLEKVLAGPKAASDIVLLSRARTRIARGYSADGVQRQGAAFLAAGDLRHGLAEISVPTVVIHGAEDPLIPVEAAEDVARAIPGARLEIVPGSGHSLDESMVAASLAALEARSTASRRR